MTKSELTLHEITVAAQQEVKKTGGIEWGDWCLESASGNPGGASNRHWRLNKSINTLQRLHVGAPEQYGLVETASVWDTTYIPEEYKGRGMLAFGTPLICWTSWHNAFPAYWELRIKAVDEVLVTKLWHDVEGFKEIVTLANDETKLHQLVSLLDPDAGEKLYLLKERQQAIKNALANIFT